MHGSINSWYLPTNITIDGTTYELRTDYRAVIDVLIACNDPDITSDPDKDLIIDNIMLKILVKGQVKDEHILQVKKELIEFIDCGIKGDGKPKPRMMDWEQDASLLIPAINKVMGKDIRGEAYMHWWTFVSAYMEIGESAFSTVLNIRNKRLHGKKLEKWEQEYFQNNKELVVLKRSASAEDKKREAEERSELKKLLYGKRK